MNKLLATLLIFIAVCLSMISAQVTSTKFQNVDVNCKPISGKPVVTISRCSAVAAEMSTCGQQKITEDLVNGEIQHQEAERKYEIIQEATNRWFESCKRWVRNFY